ncbi:heterokaryon incompatibility protein-domain-containing protein [Xylariales sp. PMI_506]|nr:heterokaryon incompatibility protein-domain-containing protein [Xylariales sp. PMI_506]
MNTQDLQGSPDMMLIDLELQCLTRTSMHLKYTCLSYVWGDTGALFSATRKTLAQLLEPGVFTRYADRIPQTIRDAMKVTRALGVRFLWVDRLCIVQDDDDMMQEQIKWMASIYGCSYFTIVAAAGSDSESGLAGVTNSRPPEHILLELNGVAQFAIHGSLWYREEYQKDSIYSSRAWTFQERLLSPRCLVFYRNTVKWECGEETCYELLNISPRIKSSFKLSFVGFPFNPKIKAEPQNFIELARDYSGRKLSFEVDAMKAFTAILTQLAPSIPGGIHFGLPEGSFHIGLAWHEWISPRLVRRREFPSWSWLGWKGQSALPPHAIWYILDRKFDNGGLPPPIPLVEWHKEEKWVHNTVPIANYLNHWESFHHSLKNPFLCELSQTSPAWDPDDLWRWSPIIRGRVKTGKLRMGDLLARDYTRSHLLDVNGRWCGTIQPTDGTGSIYRPGELCEILPVSRGQYTVSGLRAALSWDLDIIQGHLDASIKSVSDETVGYSIIHALSICWENDTAYRDGLCYIWAETWDQVQTQEMDIALG